jgi:hypothetical protein
METRRRQRQKERIMPARNKLNRAYLNGSLLMAAAVGVASRSWLVFGLALAALLAANLLAREIRPRGPRGPD